MAEYFLVPEENLSGDTLRLPESISFADGSLVEPTACVVKSLRRAGLMGGERILVIGLGIMGQLHVALARHYGAELIIGTDFIPYRCSKALELGADKVIDPSRENLVEELRETTQGEMADIVIVGPGTITAMELGVQCASRGGTVVLFTASPPEATLGVSPYHIYFHEVRLVPSYSCGPNDTREALRLVSTNAIKAEQFITHRFPFTAVADAYKTAAEAKESLKTVVVFS
jgi:L-iditol 2-dehydrogenase